VPDRHGLKSEGPPEPPEIANQSSPGPVWHALEFEAAPQPSARV
jgi:hypothetical protein